MTPEEVAALRAQVESHPGWRLIETHPTGGPETVYLALRTVGAGEMVDTSMDGWEAKLIAIDESYQRQSGGS